MPTIIQIPAADNNVSTCAMTSEATTTSASSAKKKSQAPKLKKQSSHKKAKTPSKKSLQSSAKKTKMPSTSIKDYFSSAGKSKTKAPNTTPGKSKTNASNTTPGKSKTNASNTTPGKSKSKEPNTTPGKKTPKKSSSKDNKNKTLSLLEELQAPHKSGKNTPKKNTASNTKNGSSTKNKNKTAPSVAKTKEKALSTADKKAASKSEKEKSKDSSSTSKKKTPASLKTKDKSGSTTPKATVKNGKKKTKENKPKKVTPQSSPNSVDGASDSFLLSQEFAQSINEVLASDSALTCVENIELAEECPPSLLTPKPKQKPKLKLKAPSRRLTYKEMLVHTLVECKDFRNGMTLEALCKILPRRFTKELQDTAPEKLRKSTRSAINSAMKDNTIIQVQNRRSYKLTPEGRKIVCNKKKLQERMQKQAEKDKLKRVELEKNRMEKKKRLEEQKKSKEEDRTRKEGELKHKKEAELKRTLKERERRESDLKRQAEERKRLEVERKRVAFIQRRKFPMDDLKLIEEDLALQVTPPVTQPRPEIPSLTEIFNFTNIPSREMIYDALQIYQILQGDIGGVAFAESTIPKFSLTEWLSCIAKMHSSSKEQLPSLMAELFYQVLKKLLLSSSDAKKPVAKRLQTSLNKLETALHPYSWPHVCYEYMKVMDNYSKCSDLDAAWIYDKEDYLVYGPPPTECYGYLGADDGVIYQAHAQLATVDVCTMSCVEIITLLKLLCDDLVAGMEDFLSKIREERLALERNKKLCEVVYRRVKTGFEAAQKSKEEEKEKDKKMEIETGKNIDNEEAKEKDSIDTADQTKEKEKKSPDSNNVTEAQAEGKSTKEKENISSMEEGDDTIDQNEGKDASHTLLNGVKKKGQAEEREDEGHKTPMTKTQKFYTQEEYDSAKETKDEAIKEYEEACRIMITNTTPVGQDRQFRSYFSFPYDPSLILMEDKQNQDHHFSLITCRSTLDALLSSFDIRGTREHQLHSQLSAIRRHLHDDAKAKKETLNKEKEMNDLVQKLSVMKKESKNENIRRSSRTVDLEFSKVKNQIQILNVTQQDHQNQTSQSFLSFITPNKIIDCPSVTNHEEMISVFVKELTGIESMWSDDLCNSLDVDETFEKQKWKANVKKTNKMKNYKACLEIFKQALLELENYVHNTNNADVYLKGYSMLERADEGPKSWEKKIKLIKTLTGQAYKKGKSIIQEAITLSPNPIVKEGLQAALKLITNKSFKPAKVAALDILLKHGTELDVRAEEDEDDSSVQSNDILDELDDITEEHFLSEEASIILTHHCAALSLHLSSSVEDTEGEDATFHHNPYELGDHRSDWISLVQSCDTFALLEILLKSFKKDIKELISILSDKQEILFDTYKKSKSKSKKIKVELDRLNKFWTPVKITDDFIWIQWRRPFEKPVSIPARICEPYHPDIVLLLDKLNVVMYAVIGEEINLYCISKDDTHVFHPKHGDDIVNKNNECDYWKQCKELADKLFETKDKVIINKKRRVN